MKEITVYNDNAEQKVPNENPSLHLPTKSVPSLDRVDGQILQIVQDDFPIVEKPWHEISCRLSISENEVIARVRRLLESGVIRRIGPIVDNSKIGLNATALVALKVQESQVDEVAAVINQYDNVSHNYEREDEYNVWFTLAAPNNSALSETLDEIKRKAGVEEQNVISLPTVQRFKIDVRFQLTEPLGEKE